ncbi:MAG: hypothetical protein WAT77_15935 [Paracoccaceae bacterium]
MDLLEDKLPEMADTARETVFGALINGSSKVLLIDPTGETRQTVEGFGPNKLTSTSFKDFSLQRLAEERPDVVITPLLSDTFDVLDVGALLTISGFEGRILAITPPLPNLPSIVSEIRAQLLHINFSLVVSQPA